MPNSMYLKTVAIVVVLWVMSLAAMAATERQCDKDTAPWVDQFNKEIP